MLQIGGWLLVKNKLYQLGDMILRILDSTDDELLVIDCVKQTKPIWITVSDITAYKPILEVDLLKVIENIPELDNLDNEQIRAMHERYTMLTSVIPSGYTTLRDVMDELYANKW